MKDYRFSELAIHHPFPGNTPVCQEVCSEITEEKLQGRGTKDC